MQVHFRHEYEAPLDVVWSVLLDPQVLARHLPGCTRFAPAGDGAYEATLEIGIGPVKGTYGGRVQLADVQPLQSYRLVVEGGTVASQVRGEGVIRLREGDGGTTVVEVVGDAAVTGTLAGVGQRLLGTVARTLIGLFFKGMEGEVAQRVRAIAGEGEAAG